MRRELQDGYAIRPARAHDCQRIAEIERAAAERFRGWDVPDSLFEEVSPLSELEAAAAAGFLWVATDQTGEAVGFALLEIWTGGLHLEEVDVLPSHGRRGIGSALVDGVADWGRSKGYRSLTLTTYRDVPWNAPLYERLGFREVPREDWSEELAERVREEASRGLDPRRRVVMRRRLGEDSP